MNNINQIQKIAENAELAQVAYGYFHLLGKRFNSDNAMVIKVKNK
ncbi:hypothetical protein [Campylobacter troglodytis]|nr:hypothetical protein [Campylobacter troglodytis]